MRVFGISLPARLPEVALLVVRVIVGIIMLAHGWQKLTMIGPANFGQGLAQRGVPLPVFMGYVVTFTELIGAILLIEGAIIADSCPRAHYRSHRRDLSGKDRRRADRSSGQRSWSRT